MGLWACGLGGWARGGRRGEVALPTIGGSGLGCRVGSSWAMVSAVFEDRWVSDIAPQYDGLKSTVSVSCWRMVPLEGDCGMEPRFGMRGRMGLWALHN